MLQKANRRQEGNLFGPGGTWTTPRSTDRRSLLEDPIMRVPGTGLYSSAVQQPFVSSFFNLRYPGKDMICVKTMKALISWCYNLRSEGQIHERENVCGGGSCCGLESAFVEGIGNVNQYRRNVVEFSRKLGDSAVQSMTG